MTNKTAPASELTDEQINSIYQDATLQSLRPQDYRLVRDFARAIITADRALRADPVVGDVETDDFLTIAYMHGHAKGKSYAQAAFDALTAERDALLADMRLIAETDPTDAALDPQRAIRVAIAAMTKEPK